VSSDERSRFEISPEIGTVAALFRPVVDARAVLVLAHGAGAGMEHSTLGALADAVGRRAVATLRFNFPFKEQHKPRVDSRDVAALAIARAAAHARELAPGVPLFLGGHSFGGRMASHAVLEQTIPDVRGLVFCAFPLHPADRPGTSRAAHLPQITLPMLFLSGTRDALATPELLERTVAGLGRAQLHWLDTADHSYKVLKRSRKTEQPVLEEIADAIADFVNALR
jgi:uncharacterized protein